MEQGVLFFEPSGGEENEAGRGTGEEEI